MRALSVGGVSGVCLRPFLGSPLAQRSWGDSPQSCVLTGQICRHQRADEAGPMVMNPTGKVVGRRQTGVPLGLEESTVLGARG